MRAMKRAGHLQYATTLPCLTLRMCPSEEDGGLGIKLGEGLTLSRCTELHLKHKAKRITEGAFVCQFLFSHTQIGQSLAQGD